MIRIISFSQDHLVYLTESSGILVYLHQNINHIYTLQQQVNPTNTDGAISHDMDILLVGEVTETHIFVQDNGY